jgi:hypothetical protein
MTTLAFLILLGVLWIAYKLDGLVSAIEHIERHTCEHAEDAENMYRPENDK